MSYHASTQEPPPAHRRIRPPGVRCRSSAHVAPNALRFYCAAVQQSAKARSALVPSAESRRRQSQALGIRPLSAGGLRWSRRHTSRRWQSRRRRQHVMPQPHPSSRGNVSHGIPLRCTKRMPVSTARSGRRGRPPRRDRFARGSNGTTTAHRSSVTRGGMDRKHSELR